MYHCQENSTDGGAWQDYSPWDLKESHMTEQLHILFIITLHIFFLMYRKGWITLKKIVYKVRLCYWTAFPTAVSFSSFLVVVTTPIFSAMWLLRWTKDENGLTRECLGHGQAVSKCWRLWTQAGHVSSLSQSPGERSQAVYRQCFSEPVRIKSLGPGVQYILCLQDQKL